MKPLTELEKTLARGELMSVPLVGGAGDGHVFEYGPPRHVEAGGDVYAFLTIAESRLIYAAISTLPTLRAHALHRLERQDEWNEWADS